MGVRHFRFEDVIFRPAMTSIQETRNFRFENNIFNVPTTANANSGRQKGRVLGPRRWNFEIAARVLPRELSSREGCQEGGGGAAGRGMAERDG